MCYVRINFENAVRDEGNITLSSAEDAMFTASGTVTTFTSPLALNTLYRVTVFASNIHGDTMSEETISMFIIG